MRLFLKVVYGKLGSVRNALLSTFNVKVCMVWCPLCRLAVSRLEGKVLMIHSSVGFYIGCSG